MKKIILFLALTYCFAQPADATKYHISIAGLIGNSGTSPSASWPESKVSTYPFLPSDSVVIRRGDLLSGTINFARSGSAGNPIVIDAYGTGDNPILDGGATTSAALLAINGSYVTVNNLIIQNNKNANGIVYLMTGTHDITIYNCYINTGIRGVNAYHCGTGGVANIKVLHCYFFNISDTADSHPNGGGSHVQLNNCNGSGQEVGYNNCYTPDPSSANNFNYGVGDILSPFQSNGTAGSPIWIHDNNIRGGSNCQTTGYIGITSLDVGGSYQLIENNILVNSGQGGIGIMPSGGTNSTVQNNRMYSKYTGNTSNYVGLGFNDAAGVGNCTMQNNHITWYATGKTGPYNKFSFQTPPSGWTTNTADTAVDSLATETMLPDPLWTGSPWNTATTTAPTLMKRKVFN